MLLVSVLLFSATGCSSGSSKGIPESEDELPDMIMNNAVYSFGDSGRNPVVMTAAEIKIYRGHNPRTLLSDISFVQYGEDETGKTVEELSGHCDSATVTDKNTKAKLTGNVWLTKRSDNFTIDCSVLTWNDDKQEINSDGNVHVLYEDSMEINAKGFNAKLDENIYEFGKIENGRFTDDENEN